jgi:hypothetical protein
MHQHIAASRARSMLTTGGVHATTAIDPTATEIATATLEVSRAGCIHRLSAATP